MEDFKGTKGKWKNVFREATQYYPQRYEVQYGEDGECVAEFVSNEYDAQLIASAPEMLETLIDVVKAQRTGLEYPLLEIEKVIAKALGKEADNE